jgi:hypothetical protein
VNGRKQDLLKNRVRGKERKSWHQGLKEREEEAICG